MFDTGCHDAMEFVCVVDLPVVAPAPAQTHVCFYFLLHKTALLKILGALCVYSFTTVYTETDLFFYAESFNCRHVVSAVWPGRDKAAVRNNLSLMQQEVCRP